MKVTYDRERDGLRILFRDAPIESTRDEGGGLIVDYDGGGAVVGLEVTEASRRMHNPRIVEFVEHPPAAGTPGDAREGPGYRQE